MTAEEFLKRATGRTDEQMTEEWTFRDANDLIEYLEVYHHHRIHVAGYAYFDRELFPIGSKLTSKENGELIIAPPGTPDELIVGVVK